jgi:hypothetical protein
LLCDAVLNEVFIHKIGEAQKNSIIVGKYKEEPSRKL